MVRQRTGVVAGCTASVLLHQGLSCAASERQLHAALLMLHPCKLLACKRAVPSMTSGVWPAISPWHVLRQEKSCPQRCVRARPGTKQE